MFWFSAPCGVGGPWKFCDFAAYGFSLQFWTSLSFRCLCIRIFCFRIFCFSGSMAFRFCISGFLVVVGALSWDLLGVVM